MQLSQSRVLGMKEKIKAVAFGDEQERMMVKYTPFSLPIALITIIVTS